CGHSTRTGWIAESTNVKASAMNDCDIFKDIGVRLYGFVLSRRRPILFYICAWRVSPNDGQSIRIPIRKWIQEQRIDNAKDRTVRAHPERQRQHRHQGERRCFDQLLKPVSDVAPECIHRVL